MRCVVYWLKSKNATNNNIMIIHYWTSKCKLTEAKRRLFTLAKPSTEITGGFINIVLKNMFTWNSTYGTSVHFAEYKTDQVWELNFFGRRNLWLRSSYWKSKQLLLLHGWVNAAGSWSVAIKPHWYLNRAQVCVYRLLGGRWDVSTQDWCSQEQCGPLLHLVVVLEDSRLVWSWQF